MKKTKTKLSISKNMIAKITEFQLKKVKGGTTPVSLEIEVTTEIIASADASQCGGLNCH